MLYLCRDPAMDEGRPNPPEDRPRRPWLLGLVLGAITVVVVVALAVSEESGTGAENVGASGPEPAAEAPAPSAPERPAAPAAPRPARNCEATEINPGGANNYIADAPTRDSLGDGFVIGGQVRSAHGCRPLADVPIQVWLATETGDETANRATVRTGADGRFRIETAPTISQFGEPNVHVAYDGDRYDEVFIRRVVDLDDPRAVVNLTLSGG